jgi:HPr kinase/phosphorylase
LAKNREVAPDIAKQEAGAVAVGDLLRDPDVGLELALVGGHEGLNNGIRSSRIQKLGMTLAGFTGFIHPDRVQVFGSSELNYLRTLSPEAHIAAMQRLRRHMICCILITKALEVPEELLRISVEEQIPVLRSSAPSAVSIEKIASYLERRLAPRMTIHGVLLDVFGLGVLLLGPSGIGKSECALELVLKGHRLIADDYVELVRKSADRLSGTGGKVLEHHMELRGLGIINIKELFGISATSVSQNIDMAVRLERWNAEADYDRLGLDRPTIEFLGVSIPLTAMPVAPGRNVSTLVEVAARIHLLRQRKPNDELRITSDE